MKLVINTKFKDLRQTSVRMQALVKRTLGSESNSRTSFDELGVAELDWNSFLDEYYKEFGVELTELDYADYFTDSISFTDILLFPYTVTRLIYLKLTGRYRQFYRSSTLTTGDLILSVHAKRFVKREHVFIKLE